VTYLLDTQAWIWAVLGDRRLGAKARAALAGLRDTERVGLAAISLHEACRHLTKRRIVLRGDRRAWADWLRAAAAAPSLEVLPLTTEIAIATESFSPDFPQDPTVRLIAATARVHDLILLTGDRRLRASVEARTVW